MIYVETASIFSTVDMMLLMGKAPSNAERRKPLPGSESLHKVCSLYCGRDGECHVNDAYDDEDDSDAQLDFQGRCITPCLHGLISTLFGNPYLSACMLSHLSWSHRITVSMHHQCGKRWYGRKVAFWFKCIGQAVYSTALLRA